MSKTVDRIWQWGLTARIAGLLVFVSLYLPWCGHLKGSEMLLPEGLTRLLTLKGSRVDQIWLFPLAATLLILVPFAARKVWRFIVEAVLGAAILAGAIKAGIDFRQLRGVGVELAGSAGFLALLGSLWGFWRFYKTNLPIRDNRDNQDKQVAPPKTLLVLLVFVVACATSPQRLAQKPPSEQSASTWQKQAEQAVRNGEFEQAIQLYSYALYVAPQQIDILIGLAQALDRNQQTAKAIKILQQLHKNNPNHDALRLSLAWLYFKTGAHNNLPDLINAYSDRFADLHLQGAWLIYQGNIQHGQALLRRARALAADRATFADPSAIADIDCRLSEKRAADKTCPFGPVTSGHVR